MIGARPRSSWDGPDPATAPRAGATPDVARRFEELTMRLLRRAGATGPRRREPLLRSGETVEECLGCVRIRGDDGDVFLRERRVALDAAEWASALAPFVWDDAPRGDLAALAALRNAIVLDLETAGLANAPVLLAGCGRFEPGAFVVRQYLAADYGAEALLLDLTGRELESCDAVVTFNGTAFDVPALALRALVFGRRMRPPRRHVDLLPLARRRYRGVLENCRLSTLESAVLGRRRVGDLPARDIPARFHDFIRSGDPGELAPVVRHNEDDLLSTAALAVSLGVVRARPRVEASALRGLPAPRPTVTVAAPL